MTETYYDKPVTSFIAVDPGNAQSAYVEMTWGGNGHSVIPGFNIWDAGLIANKELIDRIDDSYRPDYSREVPQVYAVETPYPRGQNVSWQLMKTLRMIGRLEQLAIDRGFRVVHIDRLDVRIHVANDGRAKDSNIRSALIERWGGKDKAVGKKGSEGPLYGFRKDMWAALAVAVTYAEGAAKAHFSELEE